MEIWILRSHISKMFWRGLWIWKLRSPTSKISWSSLDTTVRPENAWIDRVLKRLEHSGFYDRPREHGAGTLANVLRRVGLGSPRRSRRRRSNSDDDLRRLERQAGQGDESARRRLAAEKRRHGLTDPVPDFIWAENELARVAYSHTMQGDLDFEHADNFRVARSDNEAELLTFIAARDKGCCGSHEWEVTDPEGTRWILGFNYGH